MSKIKKTPIIFLFLLSSLFYLPNATAFDDVTEDNPYYDAIEYLETSGGINSNTNFNPDEPITKAAFFKILLANAGVETDDIQNNYFNDLTGEEWYAPYANKAVEIGLIEASDSFQGGKYMTKIDAAKYLLKWGGIATPLYIDESEWLYSFRDFDETKKYSSQVKTALDLEIIEPYNDYYLGTHRKFTRGDAALAIYNMDSVVFTDAYVQAIADDIREGFDIPMILILEDVYTRLTEELYDSELDGEELMTEAIKSMVETAGEPYTVFMEPSAAEEFMDSLNGDYKGIGVFLEQKDDGTIVITRVIDNAPAEAAGMLAGDEIIEVDGISTEGLTIDEVIEMIQGENGTEVVIRIKREESSQSSSEINITVARGEFEVSYIDTEILENNILYYEMITFGENTATEFETLTEEAFAENNIEGIIFDLRNNGGGYVYTAIEILNHFVPENDKLFIISYNDQNIIYLSEGEGELAEYPMVILTNEYSASASEIMSGCLQEYGYADLVGETTFGKGSAQDLYEYYDGSTLKITTAHWLTPNWVDINEVGITPNIEVLDDENTSTDEQLDAAIERVKELM